MSNEEHLQRYNRRLDLHNTLQPKDYTILKEEAWLALCRPCHIKLEASF